MPRPKLKTTKMQTSVTLNIRDANFLKFIGDENLSEGIAIAVKKFLGTKEGRDLEEKMKNGELAKLDPIFS